jgi:flagellar motor component MotA
VADEFDVDAMIARFRERASAVRRRGLPPVEGDERRRIMEQMQLDYMDFAILGDAAGRLRDGVLTLEVDLRPRPEPAQDGGAGDGGVPSA